MKIVLADDHVMVRQALRGLLEHEGMTVVGEAANGDDATALVRQFRPDVAVLDLSMPRSDGLDAVRAIRTASPTTRMLLLTVHADTQTVVNAIMAGVHGYVLKSQAWADLIQAIRAAMNGDIYLSPAISRVVVNELRAAAPHTSRLLAPREIEVLRLIAAGKRSKEIAATLKLSVKTAESYRTRIMTKLDIHDVAGLVRYAIREHLIEL